MTEQEMEVNDEIRISFGDIWDLIRRNLILLLAVAVLGAAIGFCISNFVIDKEYSSSAYIFTPGSSSLINVSDLQLGKSLNSDYQEVIKSTTILCAGINAAKELAEADGKTLTEDYTYSEVLHAISFSNPGQNCILRMTITVGDPEDATYLANAIAYEAAAQLPVIMNTKAFTIYEKAVPNRTPVAPNNLRNTAIGGIAALVICAAVLFIGMLLDTSLKTEEDVKSRLGLATLGFISDLEQEEKQKKNKKKNTPVA